MNSRMFQGQPHKIKSSSRSTSLAAKVSLHGSRQRSSGKQLVLDRSGAIDFSIPLNLPEQPAMIRQQAFSEIQQGNHEAAIDLLSLLIERNPTSVSDYNNRGLLYFQNGQFTRALADYNKALELNPRLAKVYNNRANCHASMGQLVEALFDYETALDLNPANIRARINQGITFRELEMYEQAIENFDLALQFSHMISGADLTESTTTMRGHIYAHRGRTSHLSGDWNYAIADYHRALTALPSTPASSLDASQRLQTQIKTWLNDLLHPSFEA